MSPEIYLAPRDGGLSFTVMHYAGKVTYDLRGVLDKIRDTLPASILFTMKSKCCPDDKDSSSPKFFFLFFFFVLFFFARPAIKTTQRFTLQTTQCPAFLSKILSLANPKFYQSSIPINYESVFDDHLFQAATVW